MTVPWSKFVKAAKERVPNLSWEFGARRALEGKCCQSAAVLAGIIDGEYRRGFYAGPITANRPFLWFSLEPNGTMQHSWVEKDGKILDPTWWAFSDGKLGIYEWDALDQRYKPAQPAKTEAA